MLGWRYVLNLVIDAAGVPEGMAPTVLFVDDLDGPMAGTNAFAIHTAEADDQGRVVVTIAAVVPAGDAGAALPADELAARVIGAGAVGLNLEDSEHAAGGLRDVDAQGARLGAVKAAGRRLGVDLVVNARIDVHLAGIGDPTQRLEHAIERARRYVAAGADCVYPIALEDLDDLSAFVAAVRAPVNAMLRPGGPSLDQLRAVGVRRVSTAAVLYRTTMATLRDSAEALAAAAYPDAAPGSG